MENQIGLAFLTFDLTKGPVIPYSTNLTDSFCEKMALRVLFTGVAGDKSKNGDSFYGESIIPFPDDNKIVFSYLFPIQSSTYSKPEPKASAITIVFPQESQKLLYSIASDLGKDLKSITKKIQFEFESANEISKDTQQSLKMLCDFDYLSNLKNLTSEDLEKYLPTVNTGNELVITKSSIENNSDIPEVTSSVITLFTKSSDVYKELVNTFGKKFFNILSIIDGKKSVLEISSESKIGLEEVKNFINILMDKGFIKILPESVKFVVIFEYYFNILSKSIKNNLGEMGIKIIKKSLEELDESFRFGIKYDDNNTFSFENLKTAIESNGFQEEQLIQNLSHPIKFIYQELEKKNGRDYIIRFKANRSKNIEEKFGSELREKFDRQF
ncbi:MAG: hypothetical protein ACW981_19100 [Candidatus Hodarchaeales archaeon]|jgi:transcription initiation factor IIE alpha subunit